MSNSNLRPFAACQFDLRKASMWLLLSSSLAQPCRIDTPLGIGFYRARKAGYIIVTCAMFEITPSTITETAVLPLPASEAGSRTFT